MKNKKKAPEKLDNATKPTPRALNSESELDKDTKILNNPDRRKVLNLLLCGFKISAIDISRILEVHDPRSHLRYIKKIYPVQYQWIKSNGTKFKVYFIQFRAATTENSSAEARHGKE